MHHPPIHKYLALIILLLPNTAFLQNKAYWQQEANYTMTIDMDVDKYQYTGTQKTAYTNNSPDDLDRIYYHLYFNAFQPGSEMDLRLQTIADPDKRMTKNTGTPEQPETTSRIAILQDHEKGFIKIQSLKANGKTLKHQTIGTILEVELNEVLKSGKEIVFEMEFVGQVPLQIRRSGRNSKEGVALSMAQWYPKIAEYDFEGWHTDPYIGREFHGVWGSFDIKIDIHKDYIIGGSGILKNKKAIDGGKNRWHFEAENIHDFAWGADPEYLHDSLIVSGTTLHFYYKNDPKIIDNWKQMQTYAGQLLKYFESHIGDYPYKHYAVIQGGDSGMEYGMCTLVKGDRTFKSLVSVVAHEMGHMWFQHMLATNETKHAWMDEGFTKYIQHKALSEILPEKFKLEQAKEDTYSKYLNHVALGEEEPQTTHSDRYKTNSSYHVSSYTKGEVFLLQLEYIIGKKAVEETIKQYFKNWKFKHPTPNNFKRIAEKISGIHLEWYMNDWTQTTKTIDYAIEDVQTAKDETILTLKRIGEMPMPVEILVEYKNNTSEILYIPFRLMRGAKKIDAQQKKTKLLDNWPWAAIHYKVRIPANIQEIKNITIDPNHGTADTNRKNNTYHSTTN